MVAIPAVVVVEVVMVVVCVQEELAETTRASADSSARPTRAWAGTFLRSAEAESLCKDSNSIKDFWPKFQLVRRSFDRELQQGAQSNNSAEGSAVSFPRPESIQAMPAEAWVGAEGQTTLLQGLAYNFACIGAILTELTKGMLCRKQSKSCFCDSMGISSCKIKWIADPSRD